MAIGKPQFKADETVTFDYFLQTKMLSLDYSTAHFAEKFEAMKVERRELHKKLKDEVNKEAYFLLLIKKVCMEVLTGRIFDATLYKSLQVPEKVYAKSLQKYLMDHEKRKLYEEDTEKIRTKYVTKKPKELEKAVVLDCVERLEKAKFEAQQHMYMIVRQRQMPSEMINTIIMFEKEKADDQFYLDTDGLEEDDVDFNVKRMDLENDADYKKIQEDW